MVSRSDIFIFKLWKGWPNWPKLESTQSTTFRCLKGIQSPTLLTYLDHFLGVNVASMFNPFNIVRICKIALFLYLWIWIFLNWIINSKVTCIIFSMSSVTEAVMLKQTMVHIPCQQWVLQHLRAEVTGAGRVIDVWLAQSFTERDSSPLHLSLDPPLTNLQIFGC